MDIAVEKLGNGESTAERFCRDFLCELQKSPFGSMPKRDIECLLFYLFEKYELVEGKTNREKAFNLNLNESRLKTYMADSYAKYGKNMQKEHCKQVLEKLASHKTKAVIDGDYLIFLEENPVLQRDFIQSLKDMGFFTDSSFNRELIRVKLTSFIYFALQEQLLNISAINEIIKTDKRAKAALEQSMNAGKNLQEIAGDIWQIIKNQNSTGVITAIEIVKHIWDVAQAKIEA